ncbi:MAG: hypothetical protein GF307_13815 [candidate division Zixibacteria bacterium]|nr:hypothetical protein [candidate division Zixibacteria bacterium]
MNPLSSRMNTQLFLLADGFVQPKLIEFFRNHSFDIQAIDPGISDQGLVAAVELNNPSFVLSVNLDRYPPDGLFENRDFKWLNIHFGKLPEYAGTHPVQRAMINGETDIRVNLCSINSFSGSLGIIDEAGTPVFFDDTGYTVSVRCAELGEQIIEENLRKMFNPDIEFTRSEATWRKIWERDFDMLNIVNWHRTAFEIHNQIRAFSRPFSGVGSMINGSDVTIWESELADPFSFDVAPGTVLGKYKRSGLEVATGSGTLRILEFECANKWDIVKGDCFADIEEQPKIYEGV